MPEPEPVKMVRFGKVQRFEPINFPNKEIVHHFVVQTHPKKEIITPIFPSKGSGSVKFAIF